MSNIEALITEESDEWSPSQCLVEALNCADEMECCVVAYILKDSDGETRLRASNCDARDMLWLGNAIKYYATDG
jgi:hypothetical protein